MGRHVAWILEQLEQAWGVVWPGAYSSDPRPARMGAVVHAMPAAAGLCHTALVPRRMLHIYLPQQFQDGAAWGAFSSQSRTCATCITTCSMGPRAGSRCSMVSRANTECATVWPEQALHVVCHPLPPVWDPHYIPLARLWQT